MQKNRKPNEITLFPLANPRITSMFAAPIYLLDSDQSISEEMETNLALAEQWKFEVNMRVSPKSNPQRNATDTIG